MRRAVTGLLTAALLGGAAWLGVPAGADPLPALPLLGPTASPSPSPSPRPTAKPAATAAPQDRWALVVGITDYRGRVQDTVGGAADARLVRDVLLRHGWRSDRIRVLTDEQATGQAVAEGISWLQRNSSSRTFSFFHYSGHVKQRDGHEHLWPVDNRYIVDTEVARVLRAVRGTAWTSISGCHAGGFDEGLSSRRHLFTASSKATEKSYEDPRTGYSVWTGTLFGQGLGRRAADADGDGRTTVHEAVTWSAPRAHAYTRNQRPYGPQSPLATGGSGSLDLAAPRL